MYRIVRPLIFGLNPERAHSLTLQALRLVGALPGLQRLLAAMYAAPERPVEAFGLQFRNPIGLAAGYDKDALAWRGLAALGFGHIEVGTVTLRPQSGNPKPRVFRLPQDRALVNRLGFPGRGADFVARRLAGKRPPGLVLGVNIGKNKDTTNEEAAGDYVSLLRSFVPLADYIAVNISSPNTVGLRRLQVRAALEELLTELKRARVEYTDPSAAPRNKHHTPHSTPSDFGQPGPERRWRSHRSRREVAIRSESPLHPDSSAAPRDQPGTLHPSAPLRFAQDKLPILVKLSPDLGDQELDDALEAILNTGMDGVIATNTTIAREGLRSPHAAESGGLSGAPLADKSTAVLASIVRKLDGALPVVSVGGVMGRADARARLDAGAALVQVYTGLIYEGPGLVKAILQAD